MGQTHSRGIVSVILEEIMSWSAIYLLKKIVLPEFCHACFHRHNDKNRIIEIRNEVVALQIMNHSPAIF